MALADLIIASESGGNPYARNKRSSAGGLGQFIDSTWLDVLSRHRPDLVTGKSRDELLALKFDPALSREMTDAYASDNAGMLQSAGFPATPGTAKLSHFAGPQGAINILSADPNAPVGAILGQAAMKANPFLAGKTAGDLIAWADKSMGGQAMPPAQQALPTSLAPPGVATQAQPFAASMMQDEPLSKQEESQRAAGLESLMKMLNEQSTPEVSGPADMLSMARRPKVDLSKLKMRTAMRASKLI